MTKTLAAYAVLCSLVGCGGYYLGLPKATPDNYGIVGFVGKSSNEAAPSEVVTLLDQSPELLEPVGGEGVAVADFTPLHSPFEPAHPLGR